MINFIYYYYFDSQFETAISFLPHQQSFNENNIYSETVPIYIIIAFLATTPCANPDRLKKSDLSCKEKKRNLITSLFLLI